MPSDTLPTDPQDTLWRELELPEFAKTFAAGATIRGADWMAPTLLASMSASASGASASSGTSGSGDSVPHTESGGELRRRLAELPTLTVDESSASAEYVVVDELGRGGMGVVLRAQQRSLQREVALKRIRAKRKSQRAVEKLLDEARIAGSLEHPNIVPIHALGADDRGDPVLIMKRVEGAVWRELIRDPSHPRWESIKTEPLHYHLEVLTQVCRALELAHSRNVIHRDVKPENVMVGDFGEVYLLDWGLALRLDRDQAADELDAANSQGGFNVVGTPSYMAPEMLTGVDLNERTDVFLLGATLFEVLTGHVLHQGESLYQVIRQICNRKPYAFAASVPAELVAICNKATSLEPEDRYGSVAELREAVNHYQQHRAAELLVDETLERLRALERLRTDNEGAPSSDRHAALNLRKLATECRFGFKQALSMWPESPRGREGFERALSLFLDIEIEEQNEVAARALLDEFDEVHPDALARVEKLSANLEHERIKRKRLEQLAHDEDIKLLERSRGKHLLMLILPSLCIGAALVVGRRVYGLQLTFPIIVGLGIGPPIAVVALLLLSGVRQLRNRVNRRIMWAFLTICCAVLILRCLGWRLGTPINHVLLYELITTALGGMTVAITIDRSLFRSAVFSSACAVGAIIYPDPALEWLLAGGLGALLLLAVQWLRSGMATQREHKEG